ncbi:hypothetical protein Tco_0144777 [Tanacetum coccineum]
MDSIIPLGQKNTLAEYMILSVADNRPPMLDKDLHPIFILQGLPVIFIHLLITTELPGFMGESSITNARSVKAPGEGEALKYKSLNPATLLRLKANLRKVHPEKCSTK